MFEMMQYEFIQNALLASLLGSIACGIVGSLVVTKRIVSTSGSIAHCAFGGVGLGFFLNIHPLAAVLPFCLAAAFAMGIVSKKTQMAEDTVTSVFWSVCMALGILFIGLAPGYAPDLMAYLFGNILTVTREELMIMVALDAFILITVFFLYKELLALCFDEEYAAVAGLPVLMLYLFLLALVAVTVVVLIRIVGIILVLALLTIPPSIARQYTHSMSRMMGAAVAVGMGLTSCGLWLSYQFNLASGAVIILLAAAMFIASFLFQKLKHSLSS